ncbi:conserved hypothetical protein [Ricinus communis]|uniref:Uncharacterized protein n=1 Tax=Ricinus communis TaxID=3988 RepID=B9T9T6_RICCO|nr:conserved hypothetical protein [Ricinus communis]
MLPAATRAPSSSRMLTSVEGNGYPTDPENCFAFAGFTHTTGDASVSPYPSTIGTPVAVCHRAATDG